MMNRALLVLAFLLCVVGVSYALENHLTIPGVVGDVTMAGREGSILVQDVKFNPTGRSALFTIRSSKVTSTLLSSYLNGLTYAKWTVDHYDADPRVGQSYPDVKTISFQFNNVKINLFQIDVSQTSVDMLNIEFESYSIQTGQSSTQQTTETKCAYAATDNAQATVTCSAGKTIISVGFAHYGTFSPSGQPTCGAEVKGSCGASNSLSIVQSRCLGLGSCSVPASTTVFSPDPCYGVAKSLAIRVVCG